MSILVVALNNTTDTLNWLGYELGLGFDIYCRWCVDDRGVECDSDVPHPGMTTVEHNIPVSVLYDDILTLFSQSGTGSTPTHIVDYGGPMGEQLLWATADIPNDPKYALPQPCLVDASEYNIMLFRLRRFTRHDILEGLSESTSRPANCSSFRAFLNVRVDSIC